MDAGPQAGSGPDPSAGGSERLADAEAVMWRLGTHDARLRPVITVVAVLASSPGIDAVAQRAEELARQVPRFGARIVAPVTPLGPPRLVPDDAFDVAAHVRAVAAPGAGTLDDVLALAGPLAAEGLDPSRPLWHLTLVEAMAGGRAALVVRLHHCLSDGVGALQLAAVLFGVPSDGPPPAPGPRRRSGIAAALADLVDDVAHEADLGVALVRRGLPAAAALLRAAGTSPHPERLAAPLVRAATGLAGTLAAGGTPLSPVMCGRSASTVFAALAVDLDAVRAVGRAEGVTVNDVFVAAVLDGLGRYHAKHGSHPPALRLAVPIDMRTGDGSHGDAGVGGGANHFFPARMLAPLQLADGPAHRRAVHALVASARQDPTTPAYGAVAAVAARLPGAEAVAARALLAVDVIASNVAGSPVPLDLAGSEVRQLVPFGPRSGAGCNVTTVSYTGTLQVGISMDPAATPDTGTFVACLVDAFADAVGA